MKKVRLKDTDIEFDFRLENSDLHIDLYQKGVHSITYIASKEDLASAFAKIIFKIIK